MLLPAVVAEKVHGFPPIWAPQGVARILEEGLAQNKEIQSLEAQAEKLKALVPLASAEARS